MAVNWNRYKWLTLLLPCVMWQGAAALSPKEVLVVANRADAESVSLAHHYAQARAIPADNIVSIDTSLSAQISREDFDRQIRRPILQALTDRKLTGQIRCICLMWGVPIGIETPASEPPQTQRGKPKGPQTDASVDSELALLLWESHRLDGPLFNLLHWQAVKDATAPRTLMTSRIDGPTRADAMRMIKTSLCTEPNGLVGNFYVDAAGPVPELNARLRRLYTLLSYQTSIRAILDDAQSLPAVRERPHAALYVGCISPQRYLPTLMWTPGAVGWHIGPCEAQNLRDASSRQWCPQMIRNGVAATLGAVNDPTLGAFPSPDDFFALLLSGKFTVAECYWRTVPNVSWRMVLLADPLYNPFAAAPAITLEQMPKGLRPAN